MKLIDNVEHTLVSPTLGKEYCIYFLLLTIISLIILVIVIVAAITDVFNKKTSLLSALMTPLVAAEIYFVNRIFYSICSNSLN
tara:strand:- start:641 stop:889 length:249 start_codon:yes stop_codon:yes gene_type:complete